MEILQVPVISTYPSLLPSPSSWGIAPPLSHHPPHLPPPFTPPPQAQPAHPYPGGRGPTTLGGRGVWGEITPEEGSRLGYVEITGTCNISIEKNHAGICSPTASYSRLRAEPPVLTQYMLGGVVPHADRLLGVVVPLQPEQRRQITQTRRDPPVVWTMAPPSRALCGGWSLLPHSPHTDTHIFTHLPPRLGLQLPALPHTQG